MGTIAFKHAVYNKKRKKVPYIQTARCEIEKHHWGAARFHIEQQMFIVVHKTIAQRDLVVGLSTASRFKELLPGGDIIVSAVRHTALAAQVCCRARS